jgi:hypothetical protein
VAHAYKIIILAPQEAKIRGWQFNPSLDKQFERPYRKNTQHNNGLAERLRWLSAYLVSVSVRPWVQTRVPPKTKQNKTLMKACFTICLPAQSARQFKKFTSWSWEHRLLVTVCLACGRPWFQFLALRGKIFKSLPVLWGPSLSQVSKRPQRKEVST